MFYPLIRSLLFRLDPEVSHQISLSALRYVPSICFEKPKIEYVNALGLEFPHRVGLAAGLDKNGDYLDALAKLGLAFIEVGTVTPRPQAGNPKPRLFRLPQAHAIINRMGFNNKGVDALVSQVMRSNYDGILGVNIGKNKDTPLDKAHEDYIECLQKVYPIASYITVNLSSPNTPDLRQLQQGNYFKELIVRLREEQLRNADLVKRYVPLVIKVSPDESDETLKHMADVVVEHSIEGMIASNTTCDHRAVGNSALGREQGGLSGRPLLSRSNHCLALLKQVVGNEVTLIASGGIDSLSTAQEKLNLGASLLQLYTGLIYQGPGLVHRLNV